MSTTTNTLYRGASEIIPPPTLSIDWLDSDYMGKISYIKQIASIIARDLHLDLRINLTEDTFELYFIDLVNRGRKSRTKINIAHSLLEITLRHY